MPRIRTIKPEFWGDEKLAPLAAIDRLVFLGLISMADDTGRVVDSIRAIDGYIFPMTAESAAESLERLTLLERIHRGKTASAQSVIQIVNWKKHQKIDKPNVAAALPAITWSRRRVDDKSTPDRGKVVDASTLHINDLRPTTNDLRSTTNDQRQRAEADPDPERAPAPTAPRAPRTPTAAAPLADAIAAPALPPDAIAFVRQFYPKGKVDRERRADVERQLAATLKGGTPLRRGHIVFAYSAARLEAKCRDVMRESVTDPDKAIVVLLIKLSDTSDVTETAAREAQITRDQDERATALELETANTWLDAHPLVAATIDAELATAGVSLVDDDSFEGICRRFARTSLVLAAWRTAGAPDPARNGDRPMAQAATS